MAPEELRLDVAEADEISLVHQSIHEGVCVVATRRRTALGRAVKWWFPGRYFGLHHKSHATAEWKRAQERHEL